MPTEFNDDIDNRDYDNVIKMELAHSSILQILHFSAIHAIREFVTEGGFSVVLERKSPLKPYEDVADACANTMAAAAAIKPEALHCTISYCGGVKRGKPSASRKVWNFADSRTNVARPSLLGPEKGTIVGKNSSYAALLKCKDKENDWRFQFPCFTCDDLTKIPKYVDDFPDWKVWYQSRLVFPLRFRLRDKEGRPVDIIRGFLSFDSHTKNVFDVPSIFAYTNDPVAYETELEGLDVCNVGGIIADTIAMAILQEKRRIQALVQIRRKEKTDGKRNSDNRDEIQKKDPVREN